MTLHSVRFAVAWGHLEKKGVCQDFSSFQKFLVPAILCHKIRVVVTMDCVVDEIENMEKRKNSLDEGSLCC